MYNWSVDEQALKKNPAQYTRWRLEQLINYGLGDEKINADDLRSALPKLTLDPAKKRYLPFLLSF